MRIRYVALGGRSGYAEFARYFITALHGAGHDVGVTLTGEERFPTAALGRKGALAESLTRPMSAPDVNIMNCLPRGFALHAVPGALNLGFTMFETTRVSPEWVSCCNDATDGIMVPSEFCRKAFLDSGVKVPVHVVRPGVHREDVPDLVPREEDAFRFVSIFQWSDRKDPGALLTAYWQEFRASERVSLTLKTHPFNRSVDVRSAIAGLRSSLRFREHARVDVLTDVMDTDDLWRLQASADCHVSAHHAEGWGMSLVDAMACGVPVIATGYSANLDYMTPETAYLVPYEMRTVSDLKGFYDASMQWGSVYVDELRARMRHVFENREEARDVGRRARSRILSEFTPERSAAMLEAVIAITPRINRPPPQRTVSAAHMARRAVRC